MRIATITIQIFRAFFAEFSSETWLPREEEENLVFIKRKEDLNKISYSKSESLRTFPEREKSVSVEGWRISVPSKMIWSGSLLASWRDWKFAVPWKERVVWVPAFFACIFQSAFSIGVFALE
jgi:hypothetical protein